MLLDNCDKDKVFYIIQTFLTDKERSLIIDYYYDNYTSLRKIAFIYNMNHTTVKYNIDKIINRIQDYLDIYDELEDISNDNLFLINLDCYDVQILFYMILLYNNKTIKKLMRIGSDHLAKRIKRIKNLLELDYPVIYNKLFCMRKKFIKMGVAYMSLTDYDFPLYTIRDKSGKLYSLEKEKILLYSDKRKVLEIISASNKTLKKQIYDIYMIDSLAHFISVFNRGNDSFEIVKERGERIVIDNKNIGELSRFDTSR